MTAPRSPLALRSAALLRAVCLLTAGFWLLAPSLPAQVPRITADQNFTGKVALTADLTPSQITADQNDYAPAGHGTAAVLRLSSDASRTITGLQGGADGRLLVLCNVGANAIVLADESSSSTAANRFALSGNYTLAADTAVLLAYDSTSSRWRLVETTAATLSAAYQPLDSTLTALAAFNTNGLLVQTAADTFTARTITGTANQISVADGNGVSGNPTLSLAGPHNFTTLTSTALLLGAGTSPITASNLTYSSPTLSVPDAFSITSAGSIDFTAGGSNENITLTPSGTGYVGVPGGRLYLSSATSSIALGTTPDPVSGLLIYGTRGAGASSVYAIDIETTAASSVTTGHQGIFIALNTEAVAFTLANQWGIRIVDGTKGAGSTITNQTAFFAGNMTRGTSNFGFVGQVAAAAGSWNLYMSGTAANYLAGELLLGSVTDAGSYALQVTGAALFSGTITKPGGTSPLLSTNTAITSGAGAAAGTLTNAPAAGDPTKWIPVSDNGTTRYIPAW